MVRYMATANFVHNQGRRGIPFKRGSVITGLSVEQCEKYVGVGFAQKMDDESTGDDSSTKVMAQPKTRSKATKVTN